MRKLTILAIKFVLSAGLLYLALTKVDFPGLWARMNAQSLKWLVLSMAVLLLQLFVGALRWREVSNHCGAPLTVKQATRFTVIGAFFNQTLPSSIGGDAVRLLLLSRTGVGWRSAAYSVFVDRALGLIALAVIVVASLPWSYQLITNPNGRVTLTLIDLVALGAGLGFLGFGKLAWKRLKTWRVANHIHACSVIANRILFDGRIGPRITVLSFTVHLLTIAAAWCVAQSISVPVSFLDLLLLLLPVLLITMLPVSIAGWGVRETAMMVAFGYAGLSQSAGVDVSLLFGAVTFVIGAAGGIMWVCSSEKPATVLPSAI